MEWPTQSVFQSPRTGIDKGSGGTGRSGRRSPSRLCRRWPPDLEPGALVPGPLRFARGYLAEALGKGQEFHPFERGPTLHVSCTPALLPGIKDRPAMHGKRAD